MATGFPTKANWVSGDILTAAQMDDLAGTVNALSNAAATSGSVLVSNVAGTSFAYQPLQAAGKNAIINGGMDIWQRGTSIALAASTAYTSGFNADRFQTSTGANQATTISRQVTGDTTNLPNIQYALRYQRNSGQTGISTYFLAQNIETINSIPFTGKSITLSFYARAGANYSATSNALTAVAVSGTGTDGNVLLGLAGQSTVASGGAILTTTWQRFTITGTVASTATQLAVYFSFAPTGTAGANDYYEVTGVQLELGSVATTFSRAGGSIGGELALCQRYLPVLSAGGSGNADGVVGYAYGTNTTIYTIQFPVQPRVVPTGITVSGTINAYALNTPTSGTPTFNNAGATFASLLMTPTITAGQGSRMSLATGAYILFTGCEL